MTNEEMLRMQSDAHEQTMREQRTVIDGLVEALKKCAEVACTCNSISHHKDWCRVTQANAALEAAEKVRK